GVHIVKPGPSLSNIFNDKVTREVGFKLFFVFERIVELRKRHATSLEPTVHDLIDARVLFAVYRTLHVVDPWAVIVFELYPVEFFELGVAADNSYLSTFAPPHWYSSGPETVA